MNRLLSAAVIAVLPAPLLADAVLDLPGVTVDAVHIAPLSDGTSQLRFRIDNHGPRDVVLTGVSSPLAADGSLLVRRPGLGRIDAASVLIARGEEVDFGTDHLAAVLSGLEITEESVPLTFSFAAGPVDAVADVHGDDE